MIARNPDLPQHVMEVNNSRKISSPGVRGQGDFGLDLDTPTTLKSRSRHVVAGNDIPVGVEEGLVTLNFRLGLDLVGEGYVNRKDKPLKLFYTKDGGLHTSGALSLSQCVAQMRSARDRHEQNVELARCQSNASPAPFCVRTLRPVRRGQTLYVWYEEGLAREVGVPILTPVNIKGHQEYTCTECRSVYTQPNILKAHIFFQCRQSETSLLHSALTPFHTLLAKIKVAKPKGQISTPTVTVKPPNGQGETSDVEDSVGQAANKLNKTHDKCDPRQHDTLSPFSPSFSSSPSFVDGTASDDEGNMENDVEMGEEALEIETMKSEAFKVISSRSDVEVNLRKRGLGKASPSAFHAPKSSSSYRRVIKQNVIKSENRFVTPEHIIVTPEDRFMTPEDRFMAPEDRFMTPDSSTDQRLAMNLSFKSEQAVTLSAEPPCDAIPPPINPLTAYQSWDITHIDPQAPKPTDSPSSSMSPHAPIGYGSVPVCRPLNPLHLHYLTYGQLPVIGHLPHQLAGPCLDPRDMALPLPMPMPFHPRTSAPLGLVMSSPSSYAHPQPHIPRTLPLHAAPPLPSRRQGESSEGAPASPPSHPPQGSQTGKDFFLPQSRPSRTSPGNAYGLSLPSDKEPLDFLPQTFFANRSKRGHLCLYCGKLYSRKYGLKIHMRTHNGYKPLKCKICSRPFGDPSNLNKHVRLHAQGDTPYRCEYCGKVLVRRRDLERHVRSRHPMNDLPEDGLSHVTSSSPCSSPVSIVDGPDTDDVMSADVL